MLKSLLIQNYALIDHLEMQPSDQLNMITGETGAGKSIMLGAVGLLTGNRADTRVLLNGEAKCLVEGVFDVSQYDHIKSIFRQEDIEYDRETIIRREISPSGKSRAFVNDQPVTLDILKKIGPRLIDIHSQHETLLLGSNHFQLHLIDILANTGEDLATYQQLFGTYQSLNKELKELQVNAAVLTQDHDYNSFLLNELDEANLNDANQEVLENELNTLEHAEEIKLNLGEVTGALEQSDFNVNDLLNNVQSSLIRLSKFSSDLEKLAGRLESCAIELKDISADLMNIQEMVEYDPERIEELKGRLNQIYRLQQKHQVKSIEDLLRMKEELSKKVKRSSNLDQEIEHCNRQVNESLLKVKEAAEAISSKRLSIFDRLEKKVQQLLVEVGINESTVSITHEATEPSKYGIDRVDILFSANKGVPPQEIKNVASGGEFSRLMFCLKFLLAHQSGQPTIIFDEIDAGVSGEIALKMVRMMKKMASNHQVISISHLPQFAAQGDAHYYVFKDNSHKRAVSKVRKLEGDERILEIAKMIGGDEPSESAVVNARELMNP